MVVVGWVGRRRRGKSADAVRQTTADFLNGKNIITNKMYLAYEHTEWDKNHLMELENCTLLIDEAQNEMDSRTPASLINRLLGYFIAQAGKMDVNIYYTTHMGTLVDLRLRYEADAIVYCDCIGDVKNPLGFYYKVYDGEELLKQSHDSKYVPKPKMAYAIPIEIERAYIFPLYQTKQRMRPDAIENIISRRLSAIAPSPISA